MNNTDIPHFPRKKVYFEKQQSDRLCGAHCLNALLQGPFIDAFQLSEIAINLDNMERSLYGGDESLRHKQSGNVDLDGNYNIQVLSEALKKYGTEIVPLKNSEACKLLEKNMDILEAFIFNSSTHWYAIRKIDNIWFNLNSTNSGVGPEIISDFYLSAYIKGTEQIGYTNFLVKNLPPLKPLDAMIYMDLNSQQKLVPIEDIINYKKSNDKRLKDLNNKHPKEEEKKKEEAEDDKNKFKAFTGKGYQMSDENLGKFNNFINLGQNAGLSNDMDEELRLAMEMSLAEHVRGLENDLKPEPSESDHTAYNIIFKYGNETYNRRFKGDDLIADLKLFVKTKIKTFSDIELFENFPKKIYDNDYKTLQSDGISKNQILFVKLK